MPGEIESEDDESVQPSQATTRRKRPAPSNGQDDLEATPPTRRRPRLVTNRQRLLGTLTRSFSLMPVS